jgi:hypothetical protein
MLVSGDFKGLDRLRSSRRPGSQADRVFDQTPGRMPSLQRYVEFFDRAVVKRVEGVESRDVMSIGQEGIDEDDFQ